MTDRIRFHLDENVDPVIAVALRRYGADVTTTDEEGLLGSDDETQLAFAKREARVSVTHDDDFLRLAARDQTARSSNQEAPSKAKPRHWLP